MRRMRHDRTRAAGWWRRGSAERGAALVELAVALPILTVLVAGAIDFARVFKNAMVITAAARAGALYGAYDLTYANPTGITNAVNTVLSSNNMSSGPSPSVRMLCECATDAGVFTPTTPPNLCTATCAAGSHMVSRISVSVTRTFTLGGSVAPFPGSMTLTRTAIQRLQ